jgi:enoyl-[acyl-carrier protein] reductase II
MLLDRLWKTGKDFLGVEYPVMCGGMTWVSNLKLMKAVSDAGGFPVFAGGNMPPDLFEKEVNTCIDGLKSSFAVNLITIAPNFRYHLDILKSKSVPTISIFLNRKVCRLSFLQAASPERHMWKT